MTNFNIGDYIRVKSVQIDIDYTPLPYVKIGDIGKVVSKIVTKDIPALVVEIRSKDDVTKAYRKHPICIASDIADCYITPLETETSHKKLKKNFNHNNIETLSIDLSIKGKSIIATLFDEDGKYVNHAKASCHDDDVFNYDVGKQIALERLFTGTSTTAENLYEDNDCNNDLDDDEYDWDDSDWEDCYNYYNDIDAEEDDWDDSKTILDDFMQHHPYYRLNEDSIPYECPYEYGYVLTETFSNCQDCWLSELKSKPLFDFEDFKHCDNTNGEYCRYVMHCDSEEKAETFCKVMNHNGLTWELGGSYLSETYWDVYKKNTMYCFNEGMYGSIKFGICEESQHQTKRCVVLEFDDFNFSKYLH